MTLLQSAVKNVDVGHGSRQMTSHLQPAERGRRPRHRDLTPGWDDKVAWDSIQASLELSRQKDIPAGRTTQRSENKRPGEGVQTDGGVLGVSGPKTCARPEYVRSGNKRGGKNLLELFGGRVGWIVIPLRNREGQPMRGCQRTDDKEYNFGRYTP